MDYKRYENKNGDVAVIYSPGYGSGWYTENDNFENSERLLFDKRLVELVMEDKSKNITKLLLAEILDVDLEETEELNLLGIDQLIVKFIPKMTSIEITCRDGYEGIEYDFLPDLVII